MERTAPTAMILYGLIILWFAHGGHRHYHSPHRPWYRSKRHPSFADMLTPLRAESLQEQISSIRKWWLAQGRRAYPKAKRLLITADAGGSNGSRLRLWKWELQRLADELSLPVSVCHFPPGTSKWNKVEHRLFSFISSNWRGEPLADYETVVNLIAKTTTTTGLKVSCRLDHRRYPKGRKISDEEWAKINLHRDDFHGDWNYTIRPRRKR